MEIFLDKRAVRQIKLSAADAVEEGDTESLREDILEAFSEEQVEEIERRLDNGDFFEFLSEALEDWNGDDVDEIFELLETQLADLGIDIKYETRSRATVDDDDDSAEEEEDDEVDLEDADADADADDDDVELEDEVPEGEDD